MCRLFKHYPWGFFLVSRHHPFLYFTVKSTILGYIYISHHEIKGSNTFITHNAMALQNLLLLKQYIFSCLCRSLVPFTHDTASPIEQPVNADLQ